MYSVEYYRPTGELAIFDSTSRTYMFYPMLNSKANKRKQLMKKCKELEMLEKRKQPKKTAQ